MPSIAEYLNWHFKGWRHARIARDVLNTPPILPRDDGVILLSMVGTRALLPYLVAIKSFQRSLGRGRVVVLDDGTLTARDRAVLAHHLGDVEIRAISEVETGPCPRGGTWERLLTILDLRADAYVIQLDSDTVTMGPVPDVATAIEAGRSFSLRGESAATLRPAADFAGVPATPHIQRVCEAAMGELSIPGLDRPKYFRGCSGFAGFAPGRDGRARAEAFSRDNQARFGAARWAEWGTEQVTSNFVIANEVDPLLLPYDHYLNFWDEGLPADARLVHFVGTCRFHGETYLGVTRAAIAALHSPPA